MTALDQLRNNVKQISSVRVTTPLIPVILCGGTGTRLWPLSPLVCQTGQDLQRRHGCWPFHQHCGARIVYAFTARRDGLLIATVAGLTYDSPLR